MQVNLVIFSILYTQKRSLLKKMKYPVIKLQYFTTNLICFEEDENKIHQMYHIYYHKPVTLEHGGGGGGGARGQRPPQIFA